MIETLPDARARDLVTRHLEECLLVEAGAGSGKTTALVGRMVALVRTGLVDVERIAAVTFTRKAAGELRERFQVALESARRSAEPGGEEALLLERALQAIDRAFMGTIHAFCARLLRERPLEAGLDPAFRELTAQEAVLLSRRWWTVWLERLATEGDPVLMELDDVGIAPQDLQNAFEQLGDYGDVDFPAPAAPRPPADEIEAARSELEALMKDADRIFPREEPEKGWDDLQKALRSARFHRRTADWSDDRAFLEVLAGVHAKATRITLYKWESDGHFTPKVLRDRFAEWADEGSRATRLVAAWLAHRYPIALGFARKAAEEFARYRRRTGQLSFQDLLMLAAELLRRSPSARWDLGARYPRILVDEFQDTDPLQAEILFLLAAEPEEGAGADWRRAVPRPGALFVVGDPKQSIYRFRRADVALYQQVREHFQAFGQVVRLTANFRSRPPVGGLVNNVFGVEALFPADPTPHQAAFAPLEPVRDDPHSDEGVYLFDVPQCVDPAFKGRGREKPEREAEARGLAAWIASRVREGSRRPGDFLLLARGKRALDVYARALEARNLPVVVSGAGVGIEEELHELRLVLRALTDPDDPVLTVSALTGLFFGLDLDRLLGHRERGGEEEARWAFDFRRVPPEAEADGDPVVGALATLHRWWLDARREPADLVVQKLVDELGLLPWAAAGELGQVRAGALAFALDAVRSAGLEGDTSLVGALDALESALGDDETEAPLQPGREEVVRVMNLHKAKGLEAKVVVLVDPHPHTDRGTRVIVEREPGGPPVGWMRIGQPGAWPGQFDDIARPLVWEEKAAAEELFERAEEVRLLYVAATRAGDEVVISRCGDPGRAGKSPWSPLHGWTEGHGARLTLDTGAPGARDRLDTPAAEIAGRTAAVAARRTEAGRPDYSFDTVTALTRRSDEAPTGGAEQEAVGEERLGWALSKADSTGPGGFEWGSAVHAALEAAGRGLHGDRLRAAARTALLESDRPVVGGEPAELDALLALVEEVRRSPLWRRAEGSETRLVEQPFVLEQEDGSFLEGVIDLVFREEGGWVVVDYKTDHGDAPDFAERMERYRAQVGQYARAWSRITGEPVVESLVWTLGSAPSRGAGGTG